MFTQVLELQANFLKVRELAQTINVKTTPILQRPNRVCGGGWACLKHRVRPDPGVEPLEKQPGCERYNREQYPKVYEIISHMVERAPVIKTFNVDTS